MTVPDGTPTYDMLPMGSFFGRARAARSVRVPLVIMVEGDPS